MDKNNAFSYLMNTNGRLIVNVPSNKIVITERTLGEGEHAVVKLGIGFDNKRYAIKVYDSKRHLSDSPEEFEREHNFLKRINTESYLGNIGPYLCLIKEFVPGRSIAKRPNKDTLPDNRVEKLGELNTLEKDLITALNNNNDKQAEKIVKNILDVYVASLKSIKFLHDNNIFHNDLHSENILYHNKEAKIIDFGASKELHLESNPEECKKIDYKDIVENSFVNIKDDLKKLSLKNTLAKNVFKDINTIKSKLNNILNDTNNVNKTVDFLSNMKVNYENKSMFLYKNTKKVLSTYNPTKLRA